jgi:hypothetical protein
MSVPDFEQATRSRLELVLGIPWGGKAQSEYCPESLLREDLKGTNRTNGILREAAEKLYEMNKCLSLVHLTTNRVWRQVMVEKCRPVNFHNCQHSTNSHWCYRSARNPVNG